MRTCSAGWQRAGGGGGWCMQQPHGAKSVGSERLLETRRNARCGCWNPIALVHVGEMRGYHWGILSQFQGRQFVRDVRKHPSYHGLITYAGAVQVLYCDARSHSAGHLSQAQLSGTPTICQRLHSEVRAARLLAARCNNGHGLSAFAAARPSFTHGAASRFDSLRRGTVCSPFGHPGDDADQGRAVSKVLTKDVGGFQGWSFRGQRSALRARPQVFRFSWAC